MIFGNETPIVREGSLEQAGRQPGAGDLEASFPLAEMHPHTVASRQEPAQFAQRSTRDQYRRALVQNLSGTGDVTHRQPIGVGGDEAEPIGFGRGDTRRSTRAVNHLYSLRSQPA